MSMFNKEEMEKLHLASVAHFPFYIHSNGQGCSFEELDEMRKQLDKPVVPPSPPPAPLVPPVTEDPLL